MKKLITIYEIEGSYLLKYGDSESSNFQAFKLREEDKDLFNRIMKLMQIKDLRVVDAKDYAKVKVNA